MRGQGKGGVGSLSDRLRLGEYYRERYFRAALSVAPFAAAAWWVNGNLPAANLAVFFLQVAALTALYVPCAFLIILNKGARQLVLNRFGLGARRSAASRPG